VRVLNFISDLTGMLQMNPCEPAPDAELSLALVERPKRPTLHRRPMRKRPRLQEQLPTTRKVASPTDFNKAEQVRGANDGTNNANEDASDDSDDDLLAELESAVETVPVGAATQSTNPPRCHCHPPRHQDASRSESTENDACLAAVLARQNVDAVLEHLAQQEEDAERAAEQSGAAGGPLAPQVGRSSSSHHSASSSPRASFFTRGPLRAFHEPAEDGSDTTQLLDDALLVHLLGFVGNCKEVGPAVVCTRWQRCKVICDRERAVLSFELNTRLGAPLARELEVELFTACGAAVGKYYWQRVRSLMFNLRDRTPTANSTTSVSLTGPLRPPQPSSCSSSSSSSSANEPMPWWAEGGWACALCTLENPAEMERCQACNSLRGFGLLSQQRAYSAPFAELAGGAAVDVAASRNPGVPDITNASSYDVGSLSEAATVPPSSFNSSFFAAAELSASSQHSTGPTVVMNNLCARVLNGSLSPRTLATMTAAQLATPELAAKKAHWEKQGKTCATVS